MKLLNTTCLKISFFLTLAVFLLSSFSLKGNAQARSFAIQTASITSEAEARAAVAELKAKGVEAYVVKSDVPGKGLRYRVRVGKFATLQEAQTTGKRLAASGTIGEFAVMAYEAPAAAVAARNEVKPKPPAQPEVVKVPPAKETSVADVNRDKSPKMGQEPAATVKSSESPTAPIPVEAKPAAKPDSIAEIALAEARPEMKPPQPKAEVPQPKSVPDAAAAPPTRTEVPSNATPPPSSTDLASNAEPRIAAPPLADALTDASFSNSNWKIVRRSAETDKNLRAVHFVDSMTGWAAGDAGAVYRTTDGGRSWKPLLSGVSANINFIHFLDWNHGWMIGESTRKDETEGETLLLNTINGGRTWMIQKIHNLLSVYFTDLQNGWAVGKNATVLRTTNGGTDWKPVPEVQSVVGLPVESSNYNFGFCDVFFLDADHGWLIGNFYGRAQNNIGGLFATADGGQTWKRVPITLQTQKVSGRFTPGLLHSVQFTDLTNGSVTGEMNDGESRYFFALHTRNGGKTWEQFRTPSRATHSTQFLDPSNGWMAAFAPREGSAEAVVYDTTLMRTDNGGMSWQNDFVAKGSRIRSVFFLSPNKGWAVGDRGMILRYEEKSKAMN